MHRSFVALVSLGLMAGSALAQPRLISREVLFGNPDRSGVQISPDGAHLSFRAPLDGVMNVWVAPVDEPSKARPVTRDDGRGIRQYFWAQTNEHILYLQDRGGDEDWQLFSVDLDTLEQTLLTPFETIDGPDGLPMHGPDGKALRPTAQVQHVSHKSPETILVGLNKRVPYYHDIYSVNIETGELDLVLQNDGYVGFVTSDDYEVHAGLKFLPTGGLQVDRRTDDGWQMLLEVPAADSLTTAPMGLSEDGSTLYMVDSRERNTSALVAIDLSTGASTTIHSDDKADISNAIMHPTKHHPQAVATEYTRETWRVLDDSIAEDIEYLEGVADGDLIITGRSRDDSTWTVAYVMDAGPVRYYLYDRSARRADFLFTNNKKLEGLDLARMHPTVIEARDGLNLVSYLSLPVGMDSDGDARPNHAIPMVLFVHGGPWARDAWGYNPYHQWLANRGYAVLSVNFRGSTGFGKEFINAADGEWAGDMHNDLIDAVDWAVREGIAQEDRVAIMGGSYGGYATLVGLTFTPEKFACGVDIVGPSNLITLLQNIPPYWMPFLPQLTTRVGDPSTPEGLKLLEERSPLTRVNDITKPLLIGQGANDPRVKQIESDQIVDAMKANGIPVTYVLFPDEGHGFQRPENRLAFNAVAEIFLAEHLEGRYEPIDDDFEGSSIMVPAGAEQVPGVHDALPGK